MKKNILVLSSPSGGGKSTVAKFILENFKNFTFSISATTRQPRPGELHDIHYCFLSRDEFRKKIEENEFFYKKYVFYYTEKELQCFKKWCSSLKTNGKPMLDTVLEEVQLLKDESEQVQFLTRLLSKVPFFNPIFPKAVMNDFGEMVNQKIDGIRKQKKNVEMINDMFIRSIEETSFNVEVLSDMIYQKILEE